MGKYKSRENLIEEVKDLKNQLEAKEQELQKVIGIKFSYNQENKELKEKLGKQRQITKEKEEDIKYRSDQIRSKNANLVKLKEQILDLEESRQKATEELETKNKLVAGLSNWLDFVFDYDKQELPTLTVKKGNHWFRPIHFKTVGNFGNLKYKATIEKAEVTDHVNKLWGISVGLNHHKNSVRVGWNYDGDKVTLYQYVYDNGERSITPITTVNLGDVITVSITRQGTNSVKLQVMGHESIITFNKKVSFSRLLNPYFGGENTASITNVIKGQVTMFKSMPSKLSFKLLTPNWHWLLLGVYIAILYGIHLVNIHVGTVAASIIAVLLVLRELRGFVPIILNKLWKH